MADKDYRSKFNTSAEVLQQLFQDKAGPVSDQYKRWKLWMNWKEIVGATVGENTEPIAYQRGTLWLWVKNSVWMHQMSFMIEPIKNSVNEKYQKGFVKDVRLTLDRRMTPEISNEDFKRNVKKFFKE